MLIAIVSKYAEELGKDLERGFGQRVSVPRDYIMQSNVLLGYSRLGPDLSNVGARIKISIGIYYIYTTHKSPLQAH